MSQPPNPPQDQSAPQPNNAPQGQPVPQPNNAPQGQPAPQPQQFNQPQPGYAPSAYSAPAPGYGQQFAPQQFPAQPSGFAGLFSTNFATKVTAPVTKLVMLMGIIAFGIFAGFAVFDLITVFTGDSLVTLGQDPSALVVISQLLSFCFRIALALVLLGLLRIVLEFFASANEKSGSDNQ